MEKRSDKCYFCGEISQYNFTMQTPVCTHHWNMMYRQKTPKYIPDSQIIDYKKAMLLKRLKGKYDNQRDVRFLCGFSKK